MNFKNRQTILVFLRAPEKGRVKTRLARDIGEEKALALYREFVGFTLTAVKSSGMDSRICFYPENKIGLLTDWLGKDHYYMPQTGDDLGQRMENALSRVFDQGAEKAVLVGTDIPDIRASHFVTAFDLLSHRDVVLGPSLDGGYWLIGFRKEGFYPGLFHQMSWGTDCVFKTTRDKCRSAGLSLGLLPALQDIDTLADLHGFQKKNPLFPMPG